MGDEIEQIKERIDISTVVGEYVSLKRAGRNFKALCPFHQEKSPSFIVSPHRGTWHCFGCNEGGDIFSFVQKIEGIDFPGALKLLAEKAGVTLSKSSPQSTNRRQRAFEVLSAAARFYHEILIHQEAGKKALQYIESRGITSETIKTFQLGYAPNSWDIVYSWLKKKGFSDQELLDSGLVGRNERGNIYDRFRGRVMFPVADVQGRIVAFGGRIMPWHETGNEGKYINSPEGMLYEKRRVVYNLNRAKQFMREKNVGIVVEGYMDVVMLWQAGVHHVVASSGTAFTSDHIVQLKRFADELHFAFDADAAGWKATIAATQSALASGMNVRTISLPKGQDPADVAKEHTPEEVQQIFSDTKSLTGLLLQSLRVESTDVSSQGQLEALLPLVQFVKNPVQQGKMIQETAEALHVPEASIVSMLESLQEPASLPMPEESYRRVIHTAEQPLLGLILLKEEVRADIFPRLMAAMILDPECRLLYNSLKELAERAPEFFSMTTDQIIGQIDTSITGHAEAVCTRAEDSLATTTLTPLEEGHFLFQSLHRRYLRDELQAAQQQLALASEDTRTQALERFQGLAQELANVDTL